MENLSSQQGPAAKRFTVGTHRVCSPQDTFARIRDKLPAFGITRVADVTGLDTVNIPVFVCVRPNAKSLSVSQGKGLHRMHAKVSAIMESIELWHAENVVLPRVRGSHRQLCDDHAALDPRRLAIYPNGYYHDRLELDWVPATDVPSGKEVLVPYDLVSCDFVHAIDAPPPAIVKSSNGLASGNSRAEAVSHAICELLERDATSLFVRKGHFTDRTIGDHLIDLDHIDDPHFQMLYQRIQASGLSLFAWNETSDIGVPAIGCALLETRGDGHCGVYNGGHGCHLSREVALSRAVTEAAQSRLTEISGSRDDLRQSHYERAHADHKRRAGMRAFSTRVPEVDFATLPSLATSDVGQDVDLLLELLQEKGFPEVAVADLSRPEHGVAVVKVVIPGLGDFGHGLTLARTNLERRAG